MTRSGEVGARVRNARRKLTYAWGPRVLSALRKRVLLFGNPHVTIEFQGPVHLGPGFSLHAPEGGTLIVGPNVEFRRGFRLELGGGAVVQIGEDCVFTYDLLVQISTSLVIERGCQLGQNVFIADGNHKFRDHTKHFFHQGYEYRPLVIGEGAAIHSKATILNNIGRQAVIGANAVVTKPIPAWTLAVGMPAKPIEYFGPPGSEPPELSAQGADV
jgi:acetyltransferase-like isoleucine patch superfamily enzyme